MGKCRTNKNIYICITHLQVEKDNSLHNWHCKYEPVKFQTSYKKLNKHIMKPIRSSLSLSLSLSLSHNVVLWP